MFMMKLGTNKLECPHCHHHDVHQRAVAVFNRRAEDAPIERQIIQQTGDLWNWPGGDHSKPIPCHVVQEALVEVWDPMSSSQRRQSLAILFTCEHGCIFQIEYVQTTGSTSVEVTLLHQGVGSLPPAREWDDDDEIIPSENF